MASSSSRSTKENQTVLSVFKNGYGVVEKTVKPNEETLSQEPETGFWLYRLAVPDHAVYGSLDTTTNEGCTIHSVCAQVVETSSQQPCQGIRDLLAANQNKELILQLNEELTLSSSPTPQKHLHISRVVTLVGALVVVEEAQAAGSFITLPVSSIRSIVLPKKKDDDSSSTGFATTFPESSKKTFLVLRCLTKPTSVTIRYLTSGITWVPSYSLELSLAPASSAAASSSSSSTAVIPRKGAITMRALLMNDAEGTPETFVIDELSCLAGQPNIQFSHITDPISSQATVGSFISQLSGSSSSFASSSVMSNRNVLRQNVLSNAMMQQTQFNSADFGDTEYKQATDFGSDFYRYRFQSVELPRGGRTSLPVVSAAPIEYEDFYQIVVPPISRQNQQASEFDKNNHDAVHYISFRNTSPHPWTTAPVATYVNGEFSAQDTVSFTPVGAPTKVKLTTAVNVGCTSSEETRKGSAKKIVIANSTFFEHIVDVSIKVANLTFEAIKIELKKEIQGEFIDDSFTAPHTSIVRVPRPYPHANPTQTATLEFTVPAQETFQFTFSYNFLSQYQ